jgi:ABC-type glycerol-3-phosphate transport system permease component
MPAEAEVIEGDELLPPSAAAQAEVDKLAARSRRRRRVAVALRYLLLTLLAFVVLLPVWLTVVNSLLTPTRLIARPPALAPAEPQWSNYADAWNEGNLGLYLRNSFVVTLSITVGAVATAVLAAYAFAFLDFPLKRTIFVLFLATLMVPFEVTIITNYATVSDLGWVNTYQGMIVPFLATGFGAFLLRQSFLTLPKDLEEAARLDGYGHWRFLVRVVVPLSRPAIGALAVFTFLAAWNQYLWPLLVAEDDSVRTVQVGLRQLSRTNFDRFPVTFAGTILAALPIVILLIVFQKQLVRGLTTGAVKG